MFYAALFSACAKGGSGTRSVLPAMMYFHPIPTSNKEATTTQFHTTPAAIAATRPDNIMMLKSRYP